VAEAAVVGRPDDLKGESIVAFVTLQTVSAPNEALMAETCASTWRRNRSRLPAPRDPLQRCPAQDPQLAKIMPPHPQGLSSLAKR